MLDSRNILRLQGVGTSLPGLRGCKGAAEGQAARSGAGVGDFQ